MPRKCSYCKQLGHRRDHCPAYAAEHGTCRSLCSICNQPGHNKGTCPKRDPSTVTGRRAGRPRTRDCEPAPAGVRKQAPNSRRGAKEAARRVLCDLNRGAASPGCDLPDREAEADRCLASFDRCIRAAARAGPPYTIPEVLARANRIMRRRGPLGLLARAEELKRCFRYPPDMDAHVQAIIDRSVTIAVDGGAAVDK